MPKIGAYLIKILQFPVSYLLYASKTHFEGYLRQFSFQSILHRELHFLHSSFGPYRLPFAASHENFKAGFLWVQPIGSRWPADIKTLENMLTVVCPSGAKKSFRTADLNDAGKAAKRRLRRIKRAAFEEAPRLAGAKQPETGW